MVFSCEREYVRALLNSENSAYAHLREQCRGDALYLTRYSFRGEKGEIEDITQEAVLHVLKGIGGFRQGSKFDSWRMQVVKNTIRDIQRSKKRMRTVYFTDYAQGEEETRIDEFVDEKDNCSERTVLERESMRDATKLLPKQQRMMIRAYCMNEKKSLKETADDFHIPLGTFKSTLSKGRRNLRTLLQES